MCSLRASSQAWGHKPNFVSKTMNEKMSKRDTNMH